MSQVQRGAGLRAEHVRRVHEMVVGARVVVRHRLAGGSAADALGELRAADEESLVVATRRGEVRVAWVDVLACKAVPPPPVRRGRPHAVIGADALEAVMAEHWRPLERVDLGDWRLRAGAGFTGRANSCLAVGSPGVAVEEAIRRVERFYAERSLPALIALAHPADGPVERWGAGLEVGGELARRGWVVRTPTLVMTAATDDLPVAAELPLPAGLTVATGAAPDEAWLAAYHDQGAPDVPPAGRRILVSADEQLFVQVLDGEATVAVARGSLSPGWAGVTAVETAPTHRRRGIGRRLLAEVADWARARGATSTYLQVAADGTGARALYEGSGFGVHHAYHYRVAPERATTSPR